MAGCGECEILTADTQFCPAPDFWFIKRRARTSVRADVSSASWDPAQAGHVSCALVLVRADERVQGHQEKF